MAAPKSVHRRKFLQDTHDREVLPRSFFQLGDQVFFASQNAWKRSSYFSCRFCGFCHGQMRRSHWGTIPCGGYLAFWKTPKRTNSNSHLVKRAFSLRNPNPEACELHSHIFCRLEFAGLRLVRSIAVLRHLSLAEIRCRDGRIADIHQKLTWPRSSGER